MKRALITGITGQDGSYLAEFLLKKGYEVYGMVRRTSTESLERIKHLPVTIVSGDLLDQQSINRIFEDVRPQEVYNLAAQSFVHASFEQPVFTGDVTGLGVTRVLEAIRDYDPTIKFYQASSSEMFGKIIEEPQTEKTPFHPRSPYGCAKVYGHWITTNYRESYNIHASNGILFNHECLKYDYPIFIQDHNWLKIMSIEEFAIQYANFDGETDNKTGTPLEKLQVWDDNRWTNVNCVSWFKNQDKSLKIINARNAVYSVSDDHVCITEDGGEKPADQFEVGDKVKNTNYPKSINISTISLEEAELIGMIVGDGSICNKKQFTNKDPALRKRFAYLWSVVTDGSTKYYPSTSGFSGEEIGRLDLSGGSEWLNKYEFYSVSKDAFGHKYKQIPHVILNSTKDIMEAFLVGYNACDGLKKNSCRYKFKNFKTNSPILAAGLLYLVSQVTNQRYNITVEESWNHGKQQFYYSINLLSDRQTNVEKCNLIHKLRGEGIASQREIHRRTGISRSFIQKVFNGYIPQHTHHLELINNEVKKIIHVNCFDYQNYWFDLETASGTFHAGIGQGVIHNSPRRGIEFVTRKISDAVARISLGLQEKLFLGNLDAERDWGFAGDYVEAMWLMLQQSEPDDYVIATGKRHSVREFCDAAFSVVGLNYEHYVEVDQRFWRPAEVNILCGDYSKAKRVLGWKPKCNFQQLVEMMVINDYHYLSAKN